MPGGTLHSSVHVDQVTKAGVWERGASRTGPEGPRQDGKAVVESFAGERVVPSLMRDESSDEPLARYEGTEGPPGIVPAVLRTRERTTTQLEATEAGALAASGREPTMGARRAPEKGHAPIGSSGPHPCMDCGRGSFGREPRRRDFEGRTRASTRFSESMVRVHRFLAARNLLSGGRQCRRRDGAACSGAAAGLRPPTERRVQRGLW